MQICLIDFMRLHRINGCILTHFALSVNNKFVNTLRITIRGPLEKAIVDEHRDGFIIDMRWERDDSVNQGSYFCPTTDIKEAVKSVEGLVNTGNFLTNSNYGSTHSNSEPKSKGQIPVV